MINITYYGHLSFLLEIDGHSVLVDPFIKDNPINDTINIDDIKCDTILLTHGHQDHCSDVVDIYKNNDNPLLIANFEIVSWFQEKGITNVHPMNTGGKKSFDFGDLKVVNAIHSSTMPDGKSGGHPNGFVIYTKDKNIYIAGDTALTYDMKLIKEYGRLIDIAIFPIGDNFTMGIDDAVIASEFVGCDNIVGAHYDTFGYIEINHQQALDAFARKNKKLHLINIGQQLSF